ncbi:MAG: hypothetical protein BGP12_15240 [Rhodospirillales bacterium 70-18]|nr:MAG: hypothetical protein BGP12_15240 [Rhodospirillales bacterium 70-18]
MMGLSAGRWRNVLSDIQFALGWAGLSRIPARYTEKLSPQWATLISGIALMGDRYKLGHFGRYCGRAGIVPADVTAPVMDRFLNDLLLYSLIQEPERRHRDAVMAWNRCVGLYPAWPQLRLAVPDNRSTYSLPWSTFPPSLKSDIDAWLRHLSGVDLFAELEFDPLRETSLATRTKQIHLWVSALVLQREDPAALQSLADVVTSERMAKGLRFFWDRAGSKASLHAAQIAGVVRSIARHWVKLGQPELDRLKAMARKITPRATGMTTKNKNRLRPLYDLRTQQRLLTLPNRIRAEVTRIGVPTRALAQQMQTAVAIAVQLVAPIRLGNLVRLKIGTHLLRGRNGSLTLVLAEDEVKNGMPYESELPENVVALIDLYLSCYRPLLGDEGATWLFPGRDPGKPKSHAGLRQQIQDCIRKRCGLAFHPHLFRHTMAKIMLEHNPGAYGLVQRGLGHKTLATTMQYYSGMETRAALQHYDALILKLQEEELPVSGSGRRRGSKA